MTSIGDKSFAKKSENRLEEIIEKSKMLIIASNNERYSK